MVVIASPNYDNSSVPLAVRITNATDDSFDIMVQRVDGFAGQVAGIDVHYMVIEEGVYTDEVDGVKMEAVKYTSTVTDDNNSWVGQNRGYSNTYNNPVVIGQVMTYADSDFSVFWARGNSLSLAFSAANTTSWRIGSSPIPVRRRCTCGGCGH